MPTWLRTFVILFILLVGGLSAVALLRPGQGANLRVFPEALSPFTVRAFGAFYLSLMIGALPIVTSRTITSTIPFDRAGLGLIVPITAAAFVYLDVFDLGAHPFQAAYIGAYLLVLVLSIPTLAWARRAHLAVRRNQPEHTDPA